MISVETIPGKRGREDEGGVGEFQYNIFDIL
jgi:hypothetical protein